MFRFTFSLVIAALLLWAFVWLGSYQEWFQAPSYYLETTLFTAIMAFVSFNKLRKIASPESFVQAYLLSIVVQLIALLSFVGFVIYMDRRGANGNAAFFLINCLSFIGLEVSFLFVKRDG